MVLGFTAERILVIILSHPLAICLLPLLPPLAPKWLLLFFLLLLLRKIWLFCLIPNESEIWKAMRSFSAFKAPGPYGISALFYHSFWDTVKVDFILAVQSFFLLRFCSSNLSIILT